MWLEHGICSQGGEDLEPGAEGLGLLCSGVWILGWGVGVGGLEPVEILKQRTMR